MPSSLQLLLPPLDYSPEPVTFRVNQRRHRRGRAWQDKRGDDCVNRAATVAERKFDDNDWAGFWSIYRKSSRTVGEHVVCSSLHIVKSSNRVSGRSRRRRWRCWRVWTRQYKINLREISLSVEVGHGNPIALDYHCCHRAVRCFHRYEDLSGYSECVVTLSGGFAAGRLLRSGSCNRDCQEEYPCNHRFRSCRQNRSFHGQLLSNCRWFLQRRAIIGASLFIRNRDGLKLSCRFSEARRVCFSSG